MSLPLRWLLLASALMAASASAESVAPSAGRKEVTLWSQPKTPHEKTGTLKHGERLPLKGESPGWYEVALPTGASAFVQQKYTQRIGDASAQPSKLSSKVVRSVAEVPAAKPSPGHFRIHLIDVGTGLSVLVQGADFTMLFDGGSKDDKTVISGGRSHNRLLAYLAAALGSSGPADCSESGTPSPQQTDVPIDVLVMSHPHDDHGNLLADVLHCYRVKTVFDSGRINDTAFYRDFLEGVAAEKDVVYRTASAPTSSPLTVDGVAIKLPKSWTRFEDGEVVKLGADATAMILHADAESHPDPNSNSIVMRLELGGTSLLLTGDSESGERLKPTAALGDVEAELVANHSAQLHVDILQVAHHGSMTSSRQAFLDLVAPKVALIGAGPHKYGTVTLPDDEVLKALTVMKVQVLNTNANDVTEKKKDGCPEDDRVGQDNAAPGGCDNYVLEVE